MFTSTDLKATITLIRPIVERQLDDAEVIAGHREKVTAQGGDWSQVKAIVKAMIQDERDEAGGHKRVMAILHKADNALGYADMLGLGSNMNEKNSFASDDPADRDARRKMRLSEAMLDNKALSAEMLRDGLISAEAHAENIAIADGVARKLGAGVIDAETGEISEHEPASHAADLGREGAGASLPAEQISDATTLASDDEGLPALTAGVVTAASATFIPVSSGGDPIPHLGRVR